MIGHYGAPTPLTVDRFSAPVVSAPSMSMSRTFQSSFATQATALNQRMIPHTTPQTQSSVNYAKSAMAKLVAASVYADRAMSTSVSADAKALRSQVKTNLDGARSAMASAKQWLSRATGPHSTPLAKVYADADALLAGPAQVMQQQVNSRAYGAKPSAPKSAPTTTYQPSAGGGSSMMSSGGGGGYAPSPGGGLIDTMTYTDPTGIGSGSYTAPPTGSGYTDPSAYFDSGSTGGYTDSAQFSYFDQAGDVVTDTGLASGMAPMAAPMMQAPMAEPVASSNWKWYAAGAAALLFFAAR